MDETAPAMTFPTAAWTTADLMDIGLIPAGFDHALNYWRMQVGRDGMETVAVARRGVVVRAGTRADDRLPTALARAPLVADVRTRLEALPDQPAGAPDDLLSARDLLRVGHLVLNGGDWAGQRVLTAADLSAATGPHGANVSGQPSDPPRWWANVPGADRSRPLPDAPAGTLVLVDDDHGVCIVVPAWDMVIARVGTDGPPLGGHLQVLNALLRRLGLAVSPLASDR